MLWTGCLVEVTLYLKALHYCKSNLYRLTLEAETFLPLSQGPSCCCPTCRALWDLLRSPYQPGTASHRKKIIKETTHNPQSQAASWKDETYTNRDLQKHPRINKIYPAHALWNISACRVMCQLQFLLWLGRTGWDENDCMHWWAATCKCLHTPSFPPLSFFWVSDFSRGYVEGAASTQFIF